MKRLFANARVGIQWILSGSGAGEGRGTQLFSGAIVSDS